MSRARMSISLFDMILESRYWSLFEKSKLVKRDVHRYKQICIFCILLDSRFKMAYCVATCKWEVYHFSYLAFKVIHVKKPGGGDMTSHQSANSRV